MMIWGVHKTMQILKLAREGIQPGFETQGRHDQKSNTEVSVAPQKRLMQTKILTEVKQINKTTRTTVIERKVE